MEKTLVILKPDSIRRNLVGEIISRFEKKNIRILKVKIETINKDIAESHYAHVKKFPFYNDMIDYMTNGSSIIMILEGLNSIPVVRGMIGNTNPLDSPAGTIRGDYGFNSYENLIHASDSEESASIEIERFFGVQIS